MNRSIWSLISRLRTPDDPSSDAMVLDRYVQTRDASAFELLVWRHGGFVLSVCKRILVDEHAAEDAFQATFFILARKAPTVRGSLVGWLHQVARRVSLRLKRKMPKPAEIVEERVAVQSSEVSLPGDLAQVIDEEVGRLPKKMRLPVILCYLQGRSTEEVANSLGIPRGTVLSRLHHAKIRLRDLLNRRGIVAPATFLTTAVTLPSLSADFCKRLSFEAITFFNTPVATTVPTQLAQEILHMTTRKTILGMAAILILTAGLGTGVSMVLAQGEGKKGVPQAQAEAVKKDRDEVKLIEKEPQSNTLEQLKIKQSVYVKKYKALEEQLMQLLTIKSADSANEMSITVLEQSLIKIDSELIDFAIRIAKSRTAAKSNADYYKEIIGVNAGSLTNKNVSFEFEKEFETRLGNNKEYIKITNRLSDADSLLKDLRGSMKSDSVQVKEAQRRLDDLNSAINKLKGELKQEYRKSIFDQLLTKAMNAIDYDKGVIDGLELEKNQLIEVKSTLLKSIFDRQQKKLKSSLIDDEIEVLREVRKQLLKEKIQVEMQIDQQMK